MTAAHEKLVTVRFIERFPQHEPRESDPHYKIFLAARARLKKAGLLVCQVTSDYHYGGVELHHQELEFSHINDVDLDRFNHLYGLHLDDAAFQDYIEGPGNLEPLCVLHHRGQEGVHSLPEPEWNTLRVVKDPKQTISAQANNLIPVVGPPTA